VANPNLLDISLNDLVDVTVPAPADLDRLTFDDGSGEWIADELTPTPFPIVANNTTGIQAPTLDWESTAQYCNGAGTVEIQIPAQASVAWSDGAEFHVIVGTSVTSLGITAPLALSRVGALQDMGGGSVIKCKRLATDFWVIYGDIENPSYAYDATTKTLTVGAAYIDGDVGSEQTVHIGNENGTADAYFEADVLTASRAKASIIAILGSEVRSVYADAAEDRPMFLSLSGMSGGSEGILLESDIGTTVGPAASAISTLTGTSETLSRAATPTYYRTTNGAAVAVTISPASTGNWVANDIIELEQAGAGAVTLTAGAGVTLNVNAALTLVTNGQYSVVGLKYIGSDVWTVFGNLVPV
jgi:hypothetical protein